MMVNRRLMFLAMVSAVLLSGCAEKVTPREGKSVHVVPVHKSWSAVVTSTNTQKVQSEVFERAEQNFEQIAQKGVVISFSSKGQTVASQLNRWLVEQGVSPNKVDMVKQVSSQPYDIQLQFQEYLVVTEPCSSTQIGTYGFNEDGCYADNARWQSMVNPNAMINTKSNQ